MALWNVVSRLFVRLKFSGYKFNFLIYIISDIHPFFIVLESLRQKRAARLWNISILLMSISLWQSHTDDEYSRVKV